MNSETVDKLAKQLADQWELWGDKHRCAKGHEKCVDCRATVTAEVLRDLASKQSGPKTTPNQGES